MKKWMKICAALAVVLIAAVVFLLQAQSHLSVMRQENRVSRELAHGDKDAAARDAARLKNDLGK